MNTKSINTSTISVIGCGAWGTTLAKIAADNGHAVQLWCHADDVVDQIRHTRTHPALDAVVLPDTITPTISLDTALADADLIIIAVASPFIHIAADIGSRCTHSIPIVVVTKGLSEDSAHPLLIDYVAAHIPASSQYAVLSGPNLAGEIASGLPAAAVVASTNPETAQLVQSQMSTSYFRLYSSTDVAGVQLGGILKNIFAIAAGAIDGAGLGTNAKSTLMARGVQEMSRFGQLFNADSRTFYGLAGIGDLITTCSSAKSRNYQVGFQLAATGKIPDNHESGVNIPEGIRAAKMVMNLADRHHIDMPITAEVLMVLYEHKPIQTAMADLMTRPLKHE